MDTTSNQQDDVIQNERFEIDASVVFQLGESLITDAIQALMELVKNCYDADASSCKVTISTSPVDDPGSPFHGALGSIVIEDDGTGMTLEAIRRGWLTISNSGKRALKMRSGTTQKGRTPLGDKGLGRLGTQRLGSNLEMLTRCAGSPIQQHVWFSWNEFVDQKVLSDVEVRREGEVPSFPKGTKLVISGLREPEIWKSDGVTELETRLSQMISPYKAVRDFVVLANVNGSDLNLVEISNKLRELAQVRYTLTFDGELLTISGRARLNYLRPEAAADQADKAKYKKLIEDDGGKAFFDFLLKKKHATDFQLERIQEAGWFVSFRKVVSLELMDKVVRVEASKPASPGAFTGEVDFFSLGSESSYEQNIYSAQEYRDTIDRLSGIKVFRDGFGIRVSNDWLNLGSQWTKAKSYYTLKPQNTLGYIAISAKDNANLQEKTDREGFTDNPYYRNFRELLDSFVKFSGDAQQFLRRGYNDFRKADEKRESDIPEDTTPETLSLTVGKTLARAAHHQQRVGAAALRLNESVSHADELLRGLESETADVPSVQEIRTVVSSLRADIAAAGRELLDAQKYLADASKLGNVGNILVGQIETLREQIQQVFEIISLGLTAEALSHEIGNVITQLGDRTKKTSRMLKASGSKDLKLFTYLEYVESAVIALRKQMTFLEPSLRYAREKREPIKLSEYGPELLQHYTLHFVNSPIHISVNYGKRGAPFTILMNKGKLVQILDNLILNSEYWLKESFRQGAQRGSIDVEITPPYIFVSDTGPGIDPTVEHSLFEPFVSTKGRGRGRGLGLYVAQQLLRAEGCDIRLSDTRNAKGRLYRFEIDLSGVVIP